jgi:hypothetical protein
VRSNTHIVAVDIYICWRISLQRNQFVFVCDHDEGVFHKQWLEMFEELQKFFSEHGHHKVNMAQNPKLYAWINLSNLTNEKRKRRVALLNARLKL